MNEKNYMEVLVTVELPEVVTVTPDEQVVSPVIPDSPKTIPNQVLHIHIPVATPEHYGSVKYDGNLFTLDNEKRLTLSKDNLVKLLELAGFKSDVLNNINEFKTEISGTIDQLKSDVDEDLNNLKDDVIGDVDIKVGTLVEAGLTKAVLKKVPTNLGISVYAVDKSTGASVEETLIRAMITPVPGAIALYDSKGLLTSSTPDGTHGQDVTNVTYVKNKIDDAVAAVKSDVKSEIENAKSSLSDDIDDLRGYVDTSFETFDIAEIVSTLPRDGESNKLYLVPKTEPDSNDFYDEYIWENDKWEYLGTRSVEIDFSIEDIVNEVIAKLPKYNGEVEDV